MAIWVKVSKEGIRNYLDFGQQSTKEIIVFMNRHSRKFNSSESQLSITDYMETISEAKKNTGESN